MTAKKDVIDRESEERINQFCEWFELEPPELPRWQGQIIFGPEFRAWTRENGASLDWIVCGDARGLAGAYRAVNSRGSSEMGRLFNDWHAARLDLAALPPQSDEEDAPAYERISRIEKQALALPPRSIADVYRKLVMVLDPPTEATGVDERRLAHEARAALGLPLDWTPEGYGLAA